MRPLRRISRRTTFFLTMLVVLVSTVTVTAYTLWRLRVEALDRQFSAASMYARTFEEHLTQSFNVIDLTLSHLGEDAARPAALAAALRRAPYLRSLALLDGRGRIVASSEPRNLDVGIARDDFLPSLPEPRAILRAGVPWVGRDFHDGRPATPLAPAPPEALTLLPLLRDSPQGKDSWGTLLAAVNSDYFLNYYSRSLPADVGSVDLLRYDGTLLLSTDATQAPGARHASDSLAAQMGREEFGQVEQTLADGRVVLTAYRASRTYPFLVEVHLDKAHGLDGWRREAERTLLVVGAVLLAALGLASAYFARLERAARQHDADLEQLRLLGAALEATANAIMITNREGAIVWANPAFCAMTGYGIDEALGRNPRELLKSGRQTPDDYRDLWRTILAGEVWRGELLNQRKDGTPYLEYQTITPVRDADGCVRRFIAVKQDITARKQDEKRMEELSRHLVVVQESARRRLSGELHDRTSPNLAAIGINLDILEAALPSLESPVFAERIADVRALIEDTTASIREICSDLRPPVLDYAGLAVALESYVAQFQRRSGIQVCFDCAKPAARLAPTLESMLFRIIQEALTNCAKHSRARSITVSLQLTVAAVTLRIADDGIGFAPEQLGATTHTGGLGILTMREMAEFCGGRFVLESSPGSGTRIAVDIDSPEGAA